MSRDGGEGTRGEKAPTRRFRTYHEADDGAGSDVLDQVVAQRRRLAARLEEVGRVVVLASGKGGVGKSALTANLAAALAARGHAVGAVDADLNGPSLARMLGVSGARLGDGPGGVVPPESSHGVRVVSMELLQGAADTPLSWKGPEEDRYIWQSAVETGALREFLSDVAWGRLDFLLVDVPPGTDKIGRLLELVPDPDAILLVTTPSEISRFVVSKSARLATESSEGMVGLVMNMTHFVCPDCGGETPLFPGGEEPAERSTGDLEVWARVPFAPELGSATERGVPPAGSGADETARLGPALRALDRLVTRLESLPGPGDER